MEKYQPTSKDVHFRRLTFAAERAVGFRVGRVAGRRNLACFVFLECGKLSLVSAGRVQPTGFLGTMVRREQRHSLLEIFVQRNGSEDGGDRGPLCTRGTEPTSVHEERRNRKRRRAESQGCPSVSMGAFICSSCRHNRRRFLRAISTIMFLEGRV